MTNALSPLLVRLQELKLWQGNYDSLLQKKNTTESDYETIDGISALDTTGDSILSEPDKKNDWDKRVLISPSKPFEQLLEEKLAEEKHVVILKSKNKPKPFLRKGEGLARFKLNSISGLGKGARKPILRKKSAENFDNKNNKHVNDKPKSAGNNREECKRETSASIDFTPLKIPEVVMKSKGTWQKVGEVEDRQEKMLNIPRNIEIKKRKEKRSKSPAKSSEKPSVNPNANLFNSHILGKINEFALRHFLPQKNSLDFSLDETPHKTNNNCPDAPEEMPRKNHQPGEQTVYEQQLEKELRIFEQLEQRAENSSFCSTNTSILNLLSSTPNKILKTHSYNSENSVIIEEKSLETNEQQAEQCLNLRKKLEDAAKKKTVLQDFLQNLKNMDSEKEERRLCSSAKRSDFRSPPKRTSDTSFSDEERWSTNSPETRSPSPSSYYTESDTTYKDNTKIDMAVNTSFDKSKENAGHCPFCGEFEQKLKQYAKEVSDIKAQKARAIETSNELQRNKKQLHRAIDKINREHNEEIRKIKEELEIERKKLAKEKMVFEMYCKNSSKHPNRKEREEITNLKRELADIKELVKLKESKNGTTQARLRNHIKQLEKQNDELKTEVENLQKENSKLNARQKLNRKPSEAKMLHEINKNLTKLTEETLKKQLNKSGNSNKENVIREESIEELEVTSMSKQIKENNGVLKQKQDRNRIREDSVGNESAAFENTNFHTSIEKQYESVFGHFDSPKANVSNSSINEKSEKIFEDGSRLKMYSNGNEKTISPDEKIIKVKYFNGDIKETNLIENTIKYYYLETDTWHTQFISEGIEIIEYPNGQKSKKHRDGKIEISYPEGSLRIINPDGTEEEQFPDGSRTVKDGEGELTIFLPNGQKEVHTKEHKRREYPDGTVRTLYFDGTIETRYANGRIRMKDPNGILIMDTHESILK